MALFKNPFCEDYAAGYPSLDPQYFKTATPSSDDLTYKIYLNDDGSNKTLANSAAVYRTFLYACESGVYKFESPLSDDATLMWFGPEAYSGSTRNNTDMLRSYYANDPPMTVYQDIEAGKYYPIRILWETPRPLPIYSCSNSP
ncbi:hypothetical protein PWT90_02450 [Aphanocladium album]|nr:hypothetical protein PWT90_02450 [Aphanocladium album]